MWSVKCEVWSVKEAVGSEKCEVWTVKCEVWSVKCGVWSFKFGVRRVQCEVWSVKTLLRLSLKKSNGCRGKDTVGTGCLWTIGHLCLGNFRRRLARVYVIWVLTILILTIIWPLIYGKSPLFMGKSTINGHWSWPLLRPQWQQLCSKSPRGASLPFPSPPLPHGRSADAARSMALGKTKVFYGKSPFIVSFPMKNGDFPMKNHGFNRILMGFSWDLIWKYMKHIWLDDIITKISITDPITIQDIVNEHGLLMLIDAYWWLLMVVDGYWLS